MINQGSHRVGVGVGVCPPGRGFRPGGRSEGRRLMRGVPCRFGADAARPRSAHGTAAGPRARPRLRNPTLDRPASQVYLANCPSQGRTNGAERRRESVTAEGFSRPGLVGDPLPSGTFGADGRAPARDGATRPPDKLSAAMDPSPPPAEARPRIRWGLPDVAIAWGVGVVAAVVAGSIVGAAAGADADRVGDDVGVLLASVIGQAIGVIGTLALVAARKGRGSLSADFGLVARLPGGRWTTATAWVLGGIALQVASLPFLQLLVDVHGKVETQDVVKQFERARGPSLVLFAVLVVTVAPVAEELLF